MQIIQRDIKTIPLVATPDSRFVVFSDAHRGDGTGADDFAANSLIFKCALDYLYENPPIPPLPKGGKGGFSCLVEPVSGMGVIWRKDSR